MIKKKSALVIGASGLVGKECVLALLAHPDYDKVIMLVRTQLPITAAKLEQHTVDFSNFSQASSEHHHYFNVDEVYCCLGTTIKKAKSKQKFAEIDLDLVVNIANIAKQAQVTTFSVISSIGANENSKNFYSATKGKMEQSVKVLHLNNLIIVRPSLLLGKRNETRLLESIGIKVFSLLSFMLIGPLKAYKPISAKMLAQSMIALNESPENANTNAPKNLGQSHQVSSYLEYESTRISQH